MAATDRIRIATAGCGQGPRFGRFLRALRDERRLFLPSSFTLRSPEAEGSGLRPGVAQEGAAASQPRRNEPVTLAAASYPPRIVQPLAAASDLGSLQRQLRWLFILLSTALLVAALLLTWNSYGQARAALQQKATAMAERQAALLAFLMNGVQAGLEAHLAPLPPSDTPLPGSPRRITAFAVDGTGQLSHPEVQDLLPPAEEWAVALRQTESRGQAIFTRPSLREGSYWSWGLLRPADSAALIAAPFRLDRLLQIWAAAEGYEEALLLVVGPDGRPWLVPPKVTTAMGKNAATSSEAPTILVALEDSEEAGLASGWDAPLVGVSPVGKHGLTVLVAFPPEVWRKGWLRDNSDPLIFGGLLLLGLLILVHSFYRRLAHTLSERDTVLGALALSEARFRDFADAASDWFWESDRSHQRCWISRCSNAGDAARCSLLLGRSLERLGGVPASQAALQLYREALRDHRPFRDFRSEEHTSELQSRGHLVCRLLLEKKNSSKKCPAGGAMHRGRLGPVRALVRRRPTRRHGRGGSGDRPARGGGAGDQKDAGGRREQP